MINRGTNLLSGKMCLGETMRLGEVRRARRAGSAYAQLFHQPTRPYSRAHDLNHIFLLRIPVARAMCTTKCRRNVAARLRHLPFKRLSSVASCQVTVGLLLLFVT